MRAARFVVARILNELEAGQSDLRKGKMIGRAAVAQRDGGKTEVADRNRPLPEDVRSRGVAFRKDAQKPAAAVVGVVVGVELGMLRLDRDRARLLAEKFGNHLLLGVGGVGDRA